MAYIVNEKISKEHAYAMEMRLANLYRLIRFVLQSNRFARPPAHSHSLTPSFSIRHTQTCSQNDGEEEKFTTAVAAGEKK